MRSLTKICFGAVFIGAAMLTLLTRTANAQSVPIPNSSFDLGKNAPANWTTEGSAKFGWESTGRTGGRSVSVGPTPADTGAFWRAADVPLQSGQLYRLSFWSRADNANTGCIISGPGSANHDFPFSQTWTQNSFVFLEPNLPTPDTLRIGQWSGAGTVYFDDVSLEKVTPVNSNIGGLTLGDGEVIDGSSYDFRAPYNNGNYSRPLVQTTASFNTDRWGIYGSATVDYQHAVPGRRQLSGSIAVNVNYYNAGKLVVTASNDNKNWVSVGEQPGVGALNATLPAGLFPADTIWIRLAVGGSGAAQGSLQVNSYSYHADLTPGAATVASTGSLHGRTQYLDELATSPDLRVQVLDVGDISAQNGSVLKLIVTNPGTKAISGKAQVTLSPATGQARVYMVKFAARPGDCEVRIPYALLSAGLYKLTVGITSGGATKYLATTDYSVPILAASDYGYRVSPTGQDDLWWSEAPYKISQSRPAPTMVRPTVEISAARNEYTDFQVVARPVADLKSVRVSCAGLAGPHGNRIDSSQITIRRVSYVPVAQPSDSIGSAGDWPDPLSPISGPINLSAGQNQPFWVTVYVPESTPPGDYDGSVTLVASGWNRIVQVHLNVYNFTLSRETHVKTALGFNAYTVEAYQHLTAQGDINTAVGRYYSDFAAHRISPYNPVFGAAINVDWGLNSGAPASANQVKLDFKQFDSAMDKALAEYHFNTFVLPLEPQIPAKAVGPYPIDSPEYDILAGSYLSQLQDHIVAKGWLDKAFIYWYDEPAQSVFPIVGAGMQRLHKFAPKLARMLTIQPSPSLYGDVDIWCMHTNAIDEPTALEREKNGERIWWYVCCGPTAPYVTEFIDHPAVEPRVWLWQTWKYHVQGILIWETTYWNKPGAAASSPQNPWTDTMSWADGAGGTWGNGDGRFLYPPQNYSSSSAPDTSGPVDSLRWEMLRDGIQDYEYLYMLNQEVNAAEAKGVHSAALENAKSLLDVPAGITANMTTYSPDPLPLLAQRNKIARAIESLE